MIPAHCFKRSAIRGFGHVARDLILLASTFCIFNSFVTPANFPAFPIRCLFWTVYRFLQSLFGTGIWVLAHECGHQSFSTSKILNDSTGWILHSACLVPYFSWKISHGKHHKSTGHIERDMVFMPKSRERFAGRIGKFAHELGELTEDTPIATALNLIGRQLFGWPIYLLINQSGHDNHQHMREGQGAVKRNRLFQGVNHLNSHSLLFDAKDAKLIVLSDVGLVLMSGILYNIGSTYGWVNLMVWYFVPYLWVNHWLGMYTFLFLFPPNVMRNLQGPFACWRS